MNNGRKTTIAKNKKFLHRNQKVVGEILFFLFIFVFLIVALRSSYISIFKSAHNVNLVQQTRNLYTQSNVIKPRRGAIYDANGQPLAENISTYSVYLVLNHKQKSIKGRPLYVTNKHKVARVLSHYLPIKDHEILKALSPKQSAFQVSLGNYGQNISEQTKNKIQRYHLNGVHFTQQPARLYPNGTFASHLIGLAAPVNTKTGTHLAGEMGIEKAFNKLLAGRTGYREVQQNDLDGHNKHNRSVKNGDDVYTTLDYRLQTLLEGRMSAIYNNVHPSEMGAVLMNARNGDILAATQRPSFNATTKKGVNSIWRNVLTQDLYEPGSTMKPFTMSASINSHHYNGNDTFESGKYFIDGKEIPDWDPNGWGRISFNKGFALSSNVAMAHLERNMSSQTWKKYIERFKLLKPINIGLGDSVDGQMPFKYPIDQANTAFGQGIELTAMQMMRGFSAIANNGKMLRPHLISKVVNPQTHKVVRQYNSKVIGRPITANTASQVRHHMEDVVYKPYGIGHDYQIHGYPIAAKTGTAQISNGKGYSQGFDNYLYSVVGMAPANNPKYVLYITMKQPKLNGHTADQDISSIFKPVMIRALNDDNHFVRNDENIMPNVKGDKIKHAKKILNRLGLTVLIHGNKSTGTVKEQSITGGRHVIKGSRVVLVDNK